jgi:hypothetical protein
VYDRVLSEHGVRYAHYASLFFAIATSNATYVEGGIRMGHTVDTGGGAITGSVIGSGTVWANNISSINQVADNSQNISKEIKTAIKNAADFISTQTLPDDDKEDATAYLKRIADETAKSKGQANEGIVRRSIDKLTKLFSGAAAIGALATELYKLYGWVTGHGATP